MRAEEREKESGPEYQESSSTSGEGSLKIYLKEIGQVPLLTPAQEVELARKIKRGDGEARSLMIRSNLRLVVKIAHDYSNIGLPLLDLISEGNIGLMNAVERFDPNKGGKLSTYAAWWIKQSIKPAVANQSKTIRLPVHLVDKISKMRRTSLRMAEELGRDPTDEELAAELNTTAHKVAQLKTVSIRPASLDAPMGEDENTQFGDIVKDEDALSPFEMLRDKAIKHDLEEALEELDERERMIVRARFGLDGERPLTLESIGEKFNVTRERIRQLQNIALRKLKRLLRKQDEGRMRFDGKKKDANGGAAAKLGEALRRAFAVLDLEPPVEFKAVKARYKELVKRHHPDANGGDRAAEERLKTINEAYTVLKGFYMPQPMPIS